ncbi:MAG: hypothetical protein JO215_01755, partial [Ktedonobacteraceae bacterium]|nr:hypothetical protein [Ktedonobacteraceae bacterium]
RTTRDYTGGEATRLMQELIQAGAIEAKSVGEVIEIVKKQMVIAARTFPPDSFSS